MVRITVRVRNSKISTTDGPFAETKEPKRAPGIQTLALEFNNPSAK